MIFLEKNTKIQNFRNIFLILLFPLTPLSEYLYILI